jgi:hypothetical protein
MATAKKTMKSSRDICENRVVVERQRGDDMLKDNCGDVC